MIAETRFTRLLCVLAVVRSINPSDECIGQADSRQDFEAAADNMLLQLDLKVHHRDKENTETAQDFDPFKIMTLLSTTFCSIRPARAQQFVEKFMGVSPKPVYFGPGQDECAEVFFNEICPDTTLVDVRAYEFHFVNGHQYPMGPMSTHDLYTYVEHVLSPMDRWNDFMQSATGFLVRNLTTMWESFVDAGQNMLLTKSAEEGPYTVWAMAPGGLVYTYTSFVLDPAVAAQAVLFRRPCDPPPETIYQMPPAESGSWQNHSWPIQHSFLPFYSNVPVYDPEAEAQHFLQIVNLSEAAAQWTVRRQEGCVAIKNSRSFLEYRFEIPSRMNNTRTKEVPYLFDDFLAYTRRIHDSLRWQEWNAWADHHHVVLMSEISEPYEAFFRFEARLQQLGLVYLKKGRSEFDTIFVTSRDQTAVFQFKFINWDKSRYMETRLDSGIPGCADNNAAAYDWYSKVARSGISGQDTAALLWKRGLVHDPEIDGYDLPNFTNGNNLGEPFDFCAGPTEHFEAYFNKSVFECQIFDKLRLCTAA